MKTGAHIDNLQTVSAGIRPQHVRCWPQKPVQYDSVIEEVPVALVYNGVSHAVMMATPTDLKAFAVGFSFSENIIRATQDVYDLDIIAQAQGIEVHIQLSQRQQHTLRERKRNLMGATGCGICGTESLAMLTHGMSEMTTRKAHPTLISDSAIQKAVARLQQKQQLQQMTGGAHGAAWCSLDGTIEYLLEDVGRHNALDKLIGTLLLNNIETDGFILTTSRISYEMTQKSIGYGAHTLVGLSAPTSMAIETAQQYGLHLVGFARRGRHTRYTDFQKAER